MRLVIGSRTGSPPLLARGARELGEQLGRLADAEQPPDALRRHLRGAQALELMMLDE